MLSLKQWLDGTLTWSNSKPTYIWDDSANLVNFIAVDVPTEVDGGV